MAHDVSRRRFLGSAVAGAAAAGEAFGADPVQTRPLGRTGISAPIIGIGCGTSWWGDSEDEDRALEALNLAIDLGITYLDTGQAYGQGKSETWMGKVLRQRRDEVLVATKISVRDGDEALRETDRGLKRLQTDHVDIIHIHNLKDEDDLAKIEEKGGLLDVVHRLRAQKMARFIGITCHLHPHILRTALERHDFDVTQMALNAAQQGHYPGQSSTPGHSFESIAMPVAKKKGVGVIAMKVTARNQLVGGEPGKSNGNDLLRYSLSLPVSLAVVGMSRLDHIRENSQLARTFQPMPEAEMKSLAARVSMTQKAALEEYFLHHLDT